MRKILSRLKKVNIGSFLIMHTGIVFAVLIACAVLFVGIVTYQKVYLTVIAPKSIPQEDLLERQEKVNTNLFKQISHDLDIKRSQKQLQPGQLKNIFSHY